MGKLILEILVAVVLHPIAVILTWIDLARRTDETTVVKVIWAILAIVWGIGPILYILLGGGELWGRITTGMPGGRSRYAA